MVKLKIREKSISYAASKKRQHKSREAELEKLIASLEEQIDDTSGPPNMNIIERINILKDELEKLIEYRTKGAILRSKTQWYNEGEKNTKYFLNLEKRNFKQGTISN